MSGDLVHGHHDDGLHRRPPERVDPGLARGSIPVGGHHGLSHPAGAPRPGAGAGPPAENRDLPLAQTVHAGEFRIWERGRVPGARGPPPEEGVDSETDEEGWDTDSDGGGDQEDCQLSDSEGYDE